jgi:hypothetical protein
MQWRKWAPGLVLFSLIVGGFGLVPWPELGGCSLAAWAVETRAYGRQGNSGRGGRDGRAGNPGPNQTMVVDGRPGSVSVGGSDGEDGEAGDHGQRPQCGGQPRGVAYNLQAPSGGDGGPGGNGGDGGHGGSVTLYYDDPAALSLIAVMAPGGRGGRGGPGGQGTLGCRCTLRRWEVQTCSGTPGQPDHRCQTNRYGCRDGRNGRQGAPGRDGRPGQAGQLRLVNQTTPLQPDNPSQTVRLTTLAAQAVHLSRNLWTTQTGAAALLAPGSQVQDTYEVYTGRVEGTIHLDWQAERPLGAFGAAPLTTTIQRDGTLTATFPDEMWVAYTTQRQENQLSIAVTQAVRASDVTRLAWGGMQGSGSELTAVVLDLAGEAAHLDTEFRVILRTTEDDLRDSRRPRYRTVYDGVVPADQWTVTDNRFAIALGQLPIDSRSLRPGTYAQLEITAQRTLGDNTAAQTLTWQGQL